MTGPNVHALVVNYNSGAILGRCLGALKAAGASSITVLDNASTRELDELDDAVSSVGARLIRSHDNLGFGAGINLLAGACHAADQDYLWVANPDSICERDTLSELVEALGQRNASFVMPVITMGDSGSVWFAGGSIDVERGRATHWLFAQPPPARSTPGFPSPLITGANFMVGARTWRDLGGFAEELFLYWEDCLLSLKATDQDLRAIVVPSARVTHFQGSSSGGGASPTFYYYTQRNRLLVAALRGRHPLSVLIGTGVIETARLLFRPILKEPHGRVSKFRASFAGIVAGLRKESGPAR